MSSAHGLRRPTALLRTALVAGVVAVAMVGPTVPAASADETTGTAVVGRLLQAWPETGPDGHAHEGPASAPLSWVETDDGAVRVPTEDLPGVPPGATVELSVGDPVRDEGAEEHGLEPAQEVLSTGSVTPAPRAPAVRGPVTNAVTIALVAPAGTRPDADVTARDVADAVDGTVAEFWAEQTDGAIRFGVAGASEWISTAAGCADPSAMWDEAARAVGFVPGPGRHLMLYLSSQTADQPGCSYALAEVGTGPSSGGRLYVRDLLPSVMAHELGHNLGLSHSSALQCDAAVETGACRSAGYRDLYDVMGASWRQLGSLSAPQAALLGVLPAAATADLDVLDAPTEVVLAPMGGRAGTRAVRLVDAAGAVYWLEYRTATGRDAWLGRPADNRYRLDAGVLVRRGADFPDTSVLLDGTPVAEAGWEDDLQSALPVGQPVALSGGDFTLTVRSLTAGGAVLDVVPAQPATATALPAPRDGGAGRLLAGTSRTAAGVAATPAEAALAAGEAPAAMPWSPAAGVVEPAAATTDPASASASLPLGGLLVAAAGAGLAAGILLVVRRARRLRSR